MSGRSPAAGARAAYWPWQRWAQLVLVLLLIFTGAKGVLYASTVPPWWAPDEDYHWGYVNYLQSSGSLPDPERRFQAPELQRAMDASQFARRDNDPFPRGALTGDPHTITRGFADAPRTERKPATPTRPVMHAPLFHAVDAVLTKPLGGDSIFTRLWLARVVNALFGMLAIYAAWLLAAQLLRRVDTQLFATGLVAVQPMIGFASGTVTNDMPLVAFTTLSLATLCRMFRSPPSTRQGLALGAVVGAALLTKATALFLLPLAVAAYIWQRRRFGPAAHGDLRRSALTAAGVAFAIAGWFYVFLLAKHGSLLGNLGPLNTGTGQSRPLTDAPSIAGQWIQYTYVTYWSHFLYWKAPIGTPWLYIPLVFGCTAVLGLIVWLTRVLREPSQRAQARTAQAVLLLAAVLSLMLPFWIVDITRALSGNGFMLNGGRFLIPVYPAVAVLFVYGFTEIIRPRLHKLLLSVFALVAAGQGLYMWKSRVLDLYYGPGSLPFETRLVRASFYRPEIISSGTLIALVVVVAFSGLAAWAIAALNERTGAGRDASGRP